MEQDHRTEVIMRRSKHLTIVIKIGGFDVLPICGSDG